MNTSTFFLITFLIGVSLFSFGFTQPNPCDEILYQCEGFCSCSPSGNIYQIIGAVMIVTSFLGYVLFFIGDWRMGRA